MSDLSINLSWNRDSESLVYGKYSNAHEIVYNEHYHVIGDAAPDWGGNVKHTNPEQAFAAALSSCHMMTFLALAAKAKWPVQTYKDHAVAHLGKTESGKMAVTAVTLSPRVTFDDGFSVSDDEMAEMQDRAHRYCFIANSIDKAVKIDIT